MSDQMIQMIKHAPLSRTPTFSDYSALSGRLSASSTSSVSTLKVHSDDDQFWLVERHGTTDRHHLHRERSLDEHVDDNSTRSLGWSSAGAGADDFDRGEESKVRTMLNAIEETFYEEVEHLIPNNEINDDCHAWRVNNKQLRLTGRRIGDVWMNQTQPNPSGDDDNEEIIAQHGTTPSSTTSPKHTTHEQKSKNSVMRLRFDSIMSELATMAIQQVNKPFRECVEMYKMRTSPMRHQLTSSFFANDGSSSTAGSTDGESAVTPTPQYRNFFPVSTRADLIRQGTDISIYSYREMERNRRNAESRNLSRASQDNRGKQQHVAQKHDLEDLMKSSITSKPVKPRQSNTLISDALSNRASVINRPPSRLKQQQRPSTSQTQRDTVGVLRNTRNNRNKLGPLSNRSKTPNIHTDRITDAMTTTSLTTLRSDREPSKSSSYIDHRSSPFYTRLPHIGEHNQLERIHEVRSGLDRRRPMSNLYKFFLK